MKLSKVDLRHMRMALVRAIEWESSLIDAHHTMYHRRGGKVIKIVPPNDRAYVNVCRRREAAFTQLLAKLRNEYVSPRGSND